MPYWGLLTALAVELLERFHDVVKADDGSRGPVAQVRCGFDGAGI